MGSLVIDRGAAVAQLVLSLYDAASCRGDARPTCKKTVSLLIGLPQDSGATLVEFVRGSGERDRGMVQGNAAWFSQRCRQDSWR